MTTFIRRIFIWTGLILLCGGGLLLAQDYVHGLAQISGVIFLETVLAYLFMRPFCEEPYPGDLV